MSEELDPNALYRVQYDDDGNLYIPHAHYYEEYVPTEEPTETESVKAVQVPPQVQQLQQTTVISSVPVASIGPQFKQTHKERTTQDLNSIPYPDGYVPKKTKPVAEYEEPIINTQVAKRNYPPTRTKDKSVAMRGAGGKVWEDKTLTQWSSDDFRLFCGNLGTDVTGDVLFRYFKHYPSLLQTHVVSDKRTGKTKGYGFISFGKEEDYIKAMREMNGKYVGHRPILLRKSTWKDRIADQDNIQRQKELAEIAKQKITGV